MPNSNPFNQPVDSDHDPNDTDTGPLSTHHTLGTKVNQAARGNHNHDSIYSKLNHNHDATYFQLTDLDINGKNLFFPGSGEWYTWGLAGANGASAVTDSAIVRHAGKSIKVTNAANADSFVTGKINNCVVGNTYTVTAWVYVSSVGFTGFINPAKPVLFVTNNANNVAIKTSVNLNTIVLDSWTRVSITFVATETIQTLRLYAVLGSVYYADIYVSNGKFQGSYRPPPAPDIDWIALPFSGDWTNYDPATYPEAGYRRVGNRVYLRGLVKSATAVAGSTIAVLPLNYRSTLREMFPSVANNTFARIDILSNGNISWQAGGSAAFITLSGISFDVVAT